MRPKSLSSAPAHHLSEKQGEKENCGDPELVFQGSQEISARGSLHYSVGLGLNQIASLMSLLSHLQAYEHSAEKAN